MNANNKHTNIRSLQASVIFYRVNHVKVYCYVWFSDHMSLKFISPCVNLVGQVQTLCIIMVVTILKYCQVKGFEALKGLHLEPLPFDVERNLVTPTFKLKRPQLLQYYKVSFLILTQFPDASHNLILVKSILKSRQGCFCFHKVSFFNDLDKKYPKVSCNHHL